MPDSRPLSEITAEPEKPDYDRLRDEVERGLYPFEAHDEGVLFARAEWLEARVAELSGRLDGAVVLEREDADVIHRALLGRWRGGSRIALRLFDEALCGRPGKEKE